MPTVRRNHAKNQHLAAHPYRRNSSSGAMATFGLPQRLVRLDLNEIIPTSDPDEVELQVSHVGSVQCLKFQR